MVKHIVVAGFISGLVCSFALASVTDNKPDAGWSWQINKEATIKLNGFISAGVSQTNTGIDYNIPEYGSINSDWNFSANSLIGLQLIAALGHQWSAVTQIVGNGDDRNGHSAFSPEVEWAFIKYRVNNNWQTRVGRFRLPAFMYSSTQEVGYTYPWTTLPNEVYRIIPFMNINGADFIFQHPIASSDWSLAVQPFIGENTSKYDLPLDGLSSPLVETRFKENDLFGGALSISSPVTTLRFAYAQTKLTGTYGSASTVLVDNKKTSFYDVAAKSTFHGIMLTGEYAKRKAPAPIAALEGYYASVGYHIKKWMPLLTYGHLKTTNSAAISSALREAQKSLTVGLNYAINSHLLAKASVSRITPLDNTNGLFDKSPGKAHVNLYALTVNAVF